MQSKKKALFLFSGQQVNFLPQAKKIIQKLIGQNQGQWAWSFSRAHGISKENMEKLRREYDFIIISDAELAELVSGGAQESAAGSIYEGKVLVVRDLQQLYTVPEGAFLFERYMKKIIQPESFITFPPFTWKRLEKIEDLQAAEQFLLQARLISCDIETIKQNLAISCIGFSAVSPAGEMRTFVLDISLPDFFFWTRRFLNVPAPKVFQNGLYDNLYLLRWNSPGKNWAWDTAYAFHSWYSELEKDLGFLAAFFIRDFQYWKGEGKGATNLEEYHRYNAKDCYTTLCIAIAQVVEMPQWAKDNFVLSFPLVFPCLLMNQQGLLVNEEIRGRCLKKAQESLEARVKSLATMTSIPDFNASSPKQVQKLFSCFGIETKTDEKKLLLQKAKHPLLERLVDAILAVREHAKAVNQYFDPDLLVGRLFFNIHPAHTDTGRMASQKSSYWCGAQIQNFPPYAKVYLQAEPGYEFTEIDNEQSETRCTAYLAQDLNLIATVESGQDFHSLNAVKFFGADYAVAKKKQEDGSDSPVRAMAKRINHAVSYNMGAKMFVSQAGSAFMEMARRELKLPGYLTHEEIAEHLISVFDKNYPEVRGSFQRTIRQKIGFTKTLTSPAIWEGKAWTRRFFSDPSMSKIALNAAVAHGPQGLSVKIVNEGLLKIYKEICFLPGTPVKMCAQIHDSILFQIKKEEREAMVPRLQALMVTPCQVFGRTLVIPTSAKTTGQFWGKSK